MPDLTDADLDMLRRAAVNARLNYHWARRP
jgi:hypothetical protein